MIKPGSVCYVVGLTSPEKRRYNGRVVTVVAPCDRCGDICWEVCAPWIAAMGYLRSCALQVRLRPIDDPDVPVTTHTPEALTA